MPENFIFQKTDKQIERSLQNKNKLYILSIDPGIENFGVRFSKRRIIKNLDGIKIKIKTYIYEKVRLTSNYKKSLIQYFELNSQILKSDIIIIETQVGRNKKCSIIQAMIEVYFGCYGKSQNVIIKNFSSKLKYTLNNIDSKLSNYQRKNVIGPQVATHILNKY